MCVLCLDLCVACGFSFVLRVSVLQVACCKCGQGLQVSLSRSLGVDVCIGVYECVCVCLTGPMSSNCLTCSFVCYTKCTKIYS